MSNGHIRLAETLTKLGTFGKTVYKIKHKKMTVPEKYIYINNNCLCVKTKQCLFLSSLFKIKSALKKERMHKPPMIRIKIINNFEILMNGTKSNPTVLNNFTTRLSRVTPLEFINKESSYESVKRTLNKINNKFKINQYDKRHPYMYAKC